MKYLLLLAVLGVAAPAAAVHGPALHVPAERAVTVDVASICQTARGRCTVPNGPIGAACTCGPDPGSIIG